MSRPFRFGIIGGRWGVNFLRTIARRPEWTATVVARARALPLPEPFHEVPVTIDWRDLVRNREELDAIIIASPPATHIEMARFFMAHGLPLLIEKPLCLDADEALRLQQQTAETGAIVWVDHTHLFHPAYRKLKALAQGEHIVRIRSKAGNHGPLRPDVVPLWDWMPHDLAMMLDLADAVPDDLLARQLAFRHEREGYAQTVEIELTFTSGISTYSRVSNLDPAKSRLLAVRTEQAVYRYDGLAMHSLTRLDPNTPESEWFTASGEVLPVPPITPLENLLEEFTTAVHAGDTANRSLDLGVRVVEGLARADRQIQKA